MKFGMSVCVWEWELQQLVWLQAQFYIFEKVKSEMMLAATDEVHLHSEVMVPKAAIGRIIGKGGQNVSAALPFVNPSH